MKGFQEVIRTESRFFTFVQLTYGSFDPLRQPQRTSTRDESRDRLGEHCGQRHPTMAATDH